MREAYEPDTFVLATCCEVLRVSEPREQIGPVCFQPGNQGSDCKTIRKCFKIDVWGAGAIVFWCMKGYKKQKPKVLSSVAPLIGFNITISMLFTSFSRNIGFGPKILAFFLIEKETKLNSHVSLVAAFLFRMVTCLICFLLIWKSINRNQFSL